MTARMQTHTHLSGPGLSLARAAWLALAVFALGYFAAWSVYAVQQPLPSCVPAAGECNPFFLSVEDVRAAQPSLLPVEQIARAFFGLNVLLSLVFILVAVFIAWRKSDDWMALLVSTILLTLGAVGNTPDISALVPPDSALDRLITLTAFVGYFGPFTALFYFPDGRFVPRWSGWVCLALVATAGTLFVSNEFAPAALTDPYFVVLSVFLAAFVGVGIGCIVYRYRFVASPLQRQQIKWVALGLGAASAGVIAWILFAALLPPDQPSATRTLLVALTFPLLALSNTFLPISVAIALVRYRLWDVDVLIRRTLTYTLLSGTLVLVYLGSVVILQGLLVRVTGQAQSELVTVVSTLGIAALFGPLRRRVQTFIDRRFYRQKYDAAAALAAFAATARDVVDLDQLAGALLGVVGETVRPAGASLWLVGEKEQA